MKKYQLKLFSKRDRDFIYTKDLNIKDLIKELEKLDNELLTYDIIEIVVMKGIDKK